MNCIQTDKFIDSRFDNSAEELIRIRQSDDSLSNNYLAPLQDSLHSFRFSNSSTTSLGLALALSKDHKKEWNDYHQLPPLTMMDDKSVSPQQLTQIRTGLQSIDMSSNSSNMSSNPVTPDDREPISNMKRSTSFSNLSSNFRRHRTTLASNSLYPSTSTSTTTTSANPAIDSNISRYLPQNQAVITTQDNWRISLSNHIATMVLSGSKRNNNQDFIGKHILDFIDVTHRPLLLEKIVKRREDHHHSNLNGSVLICGDVLPIVKQDGSKSSASLWLKEKKNEMGSSIFIWIFEEVFQSTIKVVLKNGLIDSIDDGVSELFGFTTCQLLQKPIHTLLPHFDTSHSFFGAQTKLDANFPVMVKHVLEKNMIRIISMPTLAGLVTVGRNGTIENCNAAFSKYLFGYQNDLTLSNISLLIPQFTTLISYLERDDLLQPGYILNNLVCRDVFNSYSKISCSAITAKHRDGTSFDIDLQIKLLDDGNFALWITFDRDSVFAQYGHTTSITPRQQQQFEKEYNGTLYPTTSVIRSKSINIPTVQQDAVKKKKSVNLPTNLKADRPTVAMTKITSFSRPSFTSSKSAIETTKQHIINSTWPRIGDYSAQTLKTSIEDYEIIDELGQGAYGLVKLACLKNDPEKKRVVIKYVIKSRILVDCWTRDRKLGLIPAEIHVLHTLRKIPHINCSDMLDYFEDEDNYYIVMDLYGAGMDLFDYIELKNGMSEAEVKAIFHQVVLAVGHLHDHRIVHRDIKDENVILDLKGGVRLIDFGSAAYIKEGRKYETFVGTLDYAAPEILKGQAYTGPPQDIWACGTLLYTLIYRENPFYNIDEIMEHELRIPFVLSQDSVDLISKMLDRDIDKRLNIHQVLEHPWFHSK